MPNPQKPPESLPQYLADGLPKQDTDTLTDVQEYIADLLESRTRPLRADDLPDDAEPVDTDDGGKGTLVKETVTCGEDSCSCMAGGDEHGPYLYRYYRNGGDVKSEYVGKP